MKVMPRRSPPLRCSRGFFSTPSSFAAPLFAGLLAGYLPALTGCSARDAEAKLIEAGNRAKVGLARPVQVTVGNESNFSPSLSKDGTWLVFTSDKDVSKNLRRKPVTGGQSTPLTSHSADDFSAAISPKSSSIAFVSRRNDALGNIHVLRKGMLGNSFSTGSEDEISLADTEDTNPSWFPDGKRIIFTARRFSESTPRIMTADLSDLKAQSLGNLAGEQPTVSPDGKEIVFVRNGSIYVYREADKQLRKISSGGVIQDGQPRFSQSGERVVHIRYADDTNRDGNLDAEDRPSLWISPSEGVDPKSEPEAFRSQPLTSAAFAGFSPQLRGDLLLFTLQSRSGLDIFKLPRTGQIPVLKNQEDAKSYLESADGYFEETFVLRRLVSDSMAEGRTKEASAAALELLRWFVRHSRVVEAKAHYQELKRAFSDRPEILARSEIVMVELALDKWAYPRVQRRPSPSDTQALLKIEDELLKSSKGAGPPPQKASVTEFERSIVLAKIQASRHEFVKATQTLRTAIDRHGQHPRLKARSEFYIAEIARSMIDQDTAIRQMVVVINQNGQDRALVREVSGRIIELAGISQNRIEGLVNLRAENRSVPILPALAHLEVAKIYHSQEKLAVAANEYRQIVNGYPKSPEIEIEAAEALIEIMEKRGRLDEVEDLIFDLKDQLPKKTSPHYRKVEDALASLYIRKAEGQLRNEQFEEAKSSYLVIRTLNQYHLGAQRGLIYAAYRAGNLDEVQKSLEEDLDDDEGNASLLYLTGLARSFDMDRAKSPSDRFSIADDAIERLEEARKIDGQNVYIHQTLGWLYFQRAFWEDRYYNAGSWGSGFRAGWGRFLGFFGWKDPNWLELALDSLLSAYFLSEPNSLERASIAQNLGYVYARNGNFQKSIDFFLERISLLDRAPLPLPRAEGHLLFSAGRSAFHAGNLDLAISIQQKSLRLWKKMNDFEMVSFTSDLLALSYRENKEFEKSVQLYSTLYESQSSAKYHFNAMKAALNAAQVSAQLGHHGESLEYLAKAQNQLKEMEKDPQETETPPEVRDPNGRYAKRPARRKKKEGIQIALKGASSVHGFDREEYAALIETFRARSLEKMGLIPDSIQSTKNFIRLLEALKESKPKVWASERLSLAHNKIASLYLKAGDHKEAHANFLSASQYAEDIRPLGQKTLAKGEWVNLVNASRVALRMVQSQAANVEILKKLGDNVSSAVDALMEASIKEGKGDISAIIGLTSVLGGIRAHTPDLQKNDPVRSGSSIERQSKERPQEASRDSAPGSKLLASPQDKDPNLEDDGDNPSETDPEDSSFFNEEVDPQILTGDNRTLEDPSTKIPLEQEEQEEDQAKTEEGKDGEDQPLPVHLSEKLLKALEASESEGVTARDHLSSLYAWRGAIGDFNLHATANKAFRKIRSEAIDRKDDSWKFYQLTGDAKLSFNRFNRKVLVGGKTGNSADKLLYRRQFDRVLAQASKDPRDAYHQLRRFQAYSLLNLLRVEFPQEFKDQPPSQKGGEDQETQEPAASAGSSDEAARAEETDGDGIKEKKSSKRPDILRKWISLEEKDDFDESLGETTAIVVGHRTMDNQYFLFFHTSDGIKMQRQRFRQASFAEDTGRHLSMFLHGQEEINRLVLIPSEELYYQDWESVKIGDKPLFDAYSVSYLPQIDMYPKIARTATAASAFVGVLGNDQKALETYRKSGTNPRAIDGKRWQQELSETHIFVSELPVHINDSAAPHFQVSDKDPTFSRDWSKLGLDSVAVLVFPKVTYHRDPLNRNFGGAEGWKILSALLTMSGASSAIVPIPPQPAPKEEPRPVAGKAEDDETENPGGKGEAEKMASTDPEPSMASLSGPELVRHFAKLDFSKSIRKAGAPARVLGHGGYSLEEKEELAEDRAEEMVEAAEESEDEERWNEAARFYGEAVSYYRSMDDAESADEALQEVRNSHFRARNHASTLYFQKILTKKAEETGEVGEAAALGVGAGSAATRSGRYEEADRLFRKPLKYFEQEEEFEETGQIWKALAINFERQGKFDKSLESYENARKSFQEADLEEESAQTLLDIGNIYSSKINDYEQALKYYRKALAEFEEIDEEESTLRTRIDIANTYNRLGKSRKAISILRSVLDTMDQEDDQLSWIRSSQGLANGYYLSGQGSRASEENGRTQRAIDEMENERSRAIRRIEADNLHAMILARSGRYDDAFKGFSKSLKLSKTHKLDSLEAMLLNNYGYWLREAGDIDKSIALLERALKIDLRLGLKKDIAFDQRNLAISSLVFGNYDRAERLLRESLKTSQELKIPYNLIYCYFGLADISLRRGMHKEALAHFSKALQLSEESGQYGFIWKALAGMGIAHERRGKDGLISALEMYDRSISAIELRPYGLRADSSSTNMVSEIGTQEIYRRRIRLLAMGEKGDEAWRLHERARKRKVLDLIASQRANFPNAKYQEYLDRHLDRLDRVESISIKMSRAGTGDEGPSGEGASGRHALSFKSELGKLKNEGELGQGFAKGFQDFLSQDEIDSAALRQLLPLGTVVLDYRMTRDQLLVWVLTRESGESVKISYDAKRLSSLVSDFQEFVKAFSSTDHVTRSLYSILIEPLEKHIQGAERLVIIPDDVIGQVPFAVLDNGKEQLVDRFEISYLDSAAAGLRFLRRGKSQKKRKDFRVFALANPARPDKADLPFSEREIDAIGRYFTSIEKAKGQQATLKRVKNLRDGFDIYHFAAHGTADYISPMDSKLHLAGEGENADLGAATAFSLGLQGDLVTLSSCESGLSLTNNGLEMVSLNQAFGFSGVNAILASLWRIDDTTSGVVMKRFYRYYSEGDTKAEALRKSQILTRRYFKHPAYWAGFKLTGF